MGGEEKKSVWWINPVVYITWEQKHTSQLHFKHTPARTLKEVCSICKGGRQWVYIWCNIFLPTPSKLIMNLPQTLSSVKKAKSLNSLRILGSGQRKGIVRRDRMHTVTLKRKIKLRCHLFQILSSMYKKPPLPFNQVLWYHLRSCWSISTAILVNTEPPVFLLERPILQMGVACFRPPGKLTADVRFEQTALLSYILSSRPDQFWSNHCTPLSTSYLSLPMVWNFCQGI